MSLALEMTFIGDMRKYHLRSNSSLNLDIHFIYTHWNFYINVIIAIYYVCFLSVLFHAINGLNAIRILITHSTLYLHTDIIE